MKFRFLLLPLGLIFLISALLWIIVQKGYPEKLTIYFITKSLHKNGISLTAQSFSGNIRQGITIEEPTIRKDKTEIKAKKIYIRARRTPILWGTFWIKEFRIYGVEAKIELLESDNKQKIKIPLWLFVFAKNVFIEINKAELLSGKEKQVFENCIVEADCSYFFNTFKFSRLSVLIQKSPFKNIISFQGKGEVKLEHYANLKGEVKYGESYGKVNVSYERKEKENAFQCNLSNFTLNLKDLKNFAEFPELKIHCEAEFSFYRNDLRIKGIFDERTYGKFSIDSAGKIENKVLNGKVSVSSSPFYYSLSINEIKSDKLRIFADLEGKYSYNFKNKDIAVKFEGSFKNSEVVGIYVSSGTAQLAIDNNSLNIFAGFTSPEAGKGNLEINYNFFNRRTDIRFKTSETYPLKVLNSLGIEAPLPEPLKFSSGKFNCNLAEILFENGTITTSIDATDEKNGVYSVGLNFIDSKLQSLSIYAEKIETGRWGIDAPILFSGQMFFDFQKVGFVPLILKDTYFHFEKMEIGPLNSELKILESGKLVLPETDLNLSSGTAKIEGELANNGFYKGKVLLEKFDIEKFDSSLGEGSISGEFFFNGNFSSINFSGDFFSDKLKIKNGEFFQLKGKGSGKFKDSDIDFDLLTEADFLSILGSTFGHFRSLLKKDGDKGAFEISTIYDKNQISAKGSFALGKDKNLSLFLDSLICDMGNRRLYLTKKMILEASKNLVSVKNFQLESGNSKFLFEGSFEQGEEEAKINGNLFMDNFSIVLIPFLDIPNALSGRIDSVLEIKGTLKKPQFFGEVSLKNFAYEIPESSLKFVGMVSGHFDKDKVTITNGYLTTTDKGDLKLTGNVDISQKYPSFDIKLNAEDLPVAYKSFFSGIVDANITLNGNFNEPKIDGNINLLKGRIQLKDSFVKDLPESLVFVGKALPKEQSSFMKQFFQRLKGSLKIGAKKKLWLVRKDLLAQLSGDVLINFTKEGIQPEGKMSVDDGRFFLSGSKFDLKDSSFYFSSGKDLFPLLDIHAEKEVSGYIVSIRLQGNAEKPSLTLSSTPPLEQGEILSLILFGRTSQELNPEESARWGGTAAALAFNYEAASIFNSVSKKMKFDTMGIGTSENGNPQLGFSKYLSDRLVLEYQQTFGALPESNINLKYRINKNLSIETNSSTQNRSGADIIWERKF